MGAQKNHLIETVCFSTHNIYILVEKDKLILNSAFLSGWGSYSKTCVKWPLSKRPKIGFQDQYSLMQVKSIAECSKESILQYFQPSFNYHLSLRSLFCVFLRGCFTQALLYPRHKLVTACKLLNVIQCHKLIPTCNLFCVRTILKIINLGCNAMQTKRAHFKYCHVKTHVQTACEPLDLNMDFLFISQWLQTALPITILRGTRNLSFLHGNVEFMDILTP